MILTIPERRHRAFRGVSCEPRVEVGLGASCVSRSGTLEPMRTAGWRALARVLVCALALGIAAPAAADTTAVPAVTAIPDLTVPGQLAAVDSSTATAVVVGTAADAGYAALASSYAHRFGLPLVLLGRTSPAQPLATVLAARGAKAVLIGPVAAVPRAVEQALRARKVRVARIAGTDRATTARIIALRLRPPESSTAVFVPLEGPAPMIALAAAYANARGLPLLSLGRTAPSATVAAVRALHLIGGIAIGDSTALRDAAIARIPAVTRVIGASLASTSFILVQSVPPGAHTLVLDAAADPSPVTLIQRSHLGEPLLLLDQGDPSTAERLWLTARTDITALAATSAVPSALQATVAGIVGGRGAVGAIPPATPAPAPAIAVPASFTFSGSGFGHGVGMSQWGAYGMASDGYSASQILQHYFTGSVVAPITDAVPVNVSLASRVASASFRLEQLADPTSTLQMIAGDGSVTMLPINEVVTTRYASGSIVVSATGPVAVAPFTTTSLTFRWPGSRTDGGVAGPGATVASTAPTATPTASAPMPTPTTTPSTVPTSPVPTTDSATATPTPTPTPTVTTPPPVAGPTGGPALLRVAGPGASITSGGRYRYGYVQVTPARLSGALSLGLQVNNILSLHDEYLYGIAEVSSTWPEAAIQAQIIAARAYAYKRVRAGLRSACACNVYSDTRDQMFTGWAKLAESVGSRWKAAVDGTAISPTQGLALTVGGAVVDAYYSAADGGWTQNNEDVWGGAPLSYTRSVPDPWSLTYAAASVSRWAPRSFSQAQVARAFGAPDVAYLDLSDRYPSGAVNNAVAVSSTGQRYRIGGETFKARLNVGLGDAEILTRGIPSVWVWRIDTDVPTSTPAAAAIQVFGGRTSINAGIAGALSSTVVLTQADTATVDGRAILAAAASYAGVQRVGLLVNGGQSLDPAVKSELRRRRTTRVLIVGPAPAAVTSAILALRIGITPYTAPTPAALSLLLARAEGRPTGTPVVVVASSDVGSQALAVSLAARTRAPLLLTDGPALPSDAAAFMLADQPRTITAVGGADMLPDAMFVGLGTPVRLSTADPALASTVVASQAPDSSTPAVVLANTLADPSAVVIAAATGLPLYLVHAPLPVPALPGTATGTATVDTATGVVDTATATTALVSTLQLPGEVLALVPRLPALPLVYRIGLAPTDITALRDA